MSKPGGAVVALGTALVLVSDRLVVEARAFPQGKLDPERRAYSEARLAARSWQVTF